MDWLNGLEPHWVWLTLGLLLAGLEMLVPGVYLIWIAVAALITGVLTAVFDVALPLQVIEFVFLALIIAFSAKRFLGERPIVSSDPLMNRRGARLVGETATVVAAIEHGSGRVKLGDSEWIAHGPDVAA
ncbi:MAG TPA: NfeD family protein, partial [Croceibacterium sp.]|nr:NfeD family protein [Croceibacterium sp.]